MNIIIASGLDIGQAGGCRVIDVAAMKTGPNDQLLENVRGVARDYGMFPERGMRVAAAVSGGVDSVCLLHVLLRLRDEFDIRLSVAHLNHGVRGAAADGDQEFVRELAAQNELPFYTEKIDAPAMRRAGGPSLEQVCREQRLAFYERALERLPADRGAVAHTMNDQVETVLLRLLRGVSLRGLSSMDFIAGPIVRPLLAVSRDTILAYCRENGLSWREDETNRDESLLRNRVRHTLLPLLRERFNPNIERALFSLARRLRTDADFLDELARDALAAARGLKLESDGMSVEALSSLSDSVLSRALALAYYEIPWKTETQLEAAHIIDMMKAVREGRTGCEVSLPGGVVLRKVYDRVIFAVGGAPIAIQEFRHELTLPQIGAQTIRWQCDPPGIALEIDISSGKPREPLRDSDRMRARLDADRLADKLTIRNWRPGDRFVPLGLAGWKKVQDFFTDEKVPASERHGIPLLVAGGEIAWIVGYRIDDRFKITGETNKTISIVAKQLI